MTNPITEAVARDVFNSLKGRIHNTEWDFGAGPTNVLEDTKNLYRTMAQAAISAHLKALEEAGYVVVPREPTEAMLEADLEKWETHDPGPNADNPSGRASWAAMLNAAKEKP